VFLTSDSPVVLWSKPGPYGIGFGTADEIRLSLDRRHVLVLVWESRGAERIVRATPTFVAHQNRRTARHGYRHYFQHPEDPALDGPPLPPPRAPFAPRPRSSP